MENVSDKSKADWDRIMNTSEVGCIDEAELERLTAPVEDSMPAIYWKELGAIVAAYGAMGLFVAACFAMAGFSPEAKAFDVPEHPTVFIDFNVASKHSQDHWYLETEYHGIGGSYTEITEEEFNEDNAGLGIRWEVDEVLDVSVGFYDNSFYNTSVYAGLELHTPRKYWVSVGVALAAVSGYSGTPTNTPLVFLPVVQLGPPQMGARIGHLPFGEVKFTTFQLYVGF